MQDGDYECFQQQRGKRLTRRTGRLGGGGGTPSHLRNFQNPKGLREFLVDLMGPGEAWLGPGSLCGEGAPRPRLGCALGSALGDEPQAPNGGGTGQTQVAREDGAHTGLPGPRPPSLLACGWLPGNCGSSLKTPLDFPPQPQPPPSCLGASPLPPQRLSVQLQHPPSSSSSPGLC